MTPASLIFQGVFLLVFTFAPSCLCDQEIIRLTRSLRPNLENAILVVAEERSSRLAKLV